MNRIRSQGSSRFLIRVHPVILLSFFMPTSPSPRGRARRSGGSRGRRSGRSASRGRSPAGAASWRAGRGRGPGSRRPRSRTRRSRRRPCPPFTPPPASQHGEAVVVVVAAVERRQLGDRRAAELAAPDAPACRRAGRAASGRSGARRSAGRTAPASLRCCFSRSSWLSHGWPAPCQSCTNAHAALEQPAGDQQLPAVRRRRRTCRGSFCGSCGEVERVGRLGLHAEGQLERLGCGLRAAASFGRALQVLLVELPHEVELLALLGQRQVGVADVRDELLDCRCAACRCTCPGTTPGRNADRQFCVRDDRIAAGAHGDEAGQVLVLGAEAVGHPRAEARPRQAGRRRSSSAAATARGSARRRASSG